MDKLLQNKELLLSNITVAENKLEIKKQRIHELKRKLQLTSVLEEDYLLEIEALHSSDKVVKINNTLKQLEEKLSNNRHINNNPDIQRKNELIENLVSKIKELRSESDICSKDKLIERKKLEEDNELVLQQNLSLKTEVKSLENDAVAIQIDIDSLEVQNKEMENHIVVTQRDLEEMQEAVRVKQEQLHKSQELINNLQEELSVTKLEIETEKCKPLDAEKRGNSLFGEVEDSRVKMQQQITQLNHRYESMKRDVEKKLQLKNVLRAQTVKLSQEVNEMEIYSDENKTILNCYMIKIQNLETTAEQYKKELLQQIKLFGKHLPSAVVEFANSRIKSVWHELSAARDELNKYSKQMLEICMKIQSKNKGKLWHKLQVLQLKVKIEEFENRILEMQLRCNPMDSEKFVDIPIVQETSIKDTRSRCSILSFDNHLRPSIKPISDFPLHTKPLETRHNVMIPTPIQEEQTSHYNSIAENDNSYYLSEAQLVLDEQTPLIDITSCTDNQNLKKQISCELTTLPLCTPDKQTNVKNWIEQVNMDDMNNSCQILVDEKENKNLTSNINNSNINELTACSSNPENKVHVESFTKQQNEENFELVTVRCNLLEQMDISDMAHAQTTDEYETPLTNFAEGESTTLAYCSESFKEDIVEVSHCVVLQLQDNNFSSHILQQSDNLSLCQESSPKKLDIVDSNTNISIIDNNSPNCIERNENNISIQTISSTTIEKGNDISSTSGLSSSPSENVLEEISEQLDEPNLEIAQPSNNNVTEVFNSLPFCSADTSITESEVLQTVPLVESQNAEKDIKLEPTQNESLNSDIEMEEVNVSCITIESSSSDNLELTENDFDNEKSEQDETITVNHIPHRDSMCIEMKWKESRKITSLTSELLPVKKCNKENSLPASYCTPANKKNSDLMQQTNRKPLSERNATVKRGIMKTASSENRWRY